MSILLDPSNADNFRMTVDWGRWYIDPVPACDIAPATKDQWPSCSEVKKASSKDWSFLVLPRVAGLDGAELHRIADLDRTQRLDALKSHENYAKQIAFGRGTIIHLWCEDLLAGDEPRTITDAWLAASKYPAAAVAEAAVYLPAIRDFFDTYQPEPVAVEYVTIHRTLNGHGYGATPDALVRIEGEIVGVDWKTRNASSHHAAYAEELAQVACGARAEYMIVNDNGTARRQLLPEVKGGYVVSIKPDGARLYPLDIDKGWDYWCRLHEWWVARLDEKAGVGRVLPARTTNKAMSPAPVAPAPDRRAALMSRYQRLNVADQQRFVDAKAERKIDGADLDGVEALLDEVDPFTSTVVEPTPPIAPAPERPTLADFDVDEGETIDADEPFDLLAQRFTALPEGARQVFHRLELEARGAGRSFLASKTNGKRTQRRHHIYDGLIGLLEHDLVEDELVRLLVATAMQQDGPMFPIFKLGEVVGALSAPEALRFAELAFQAANEPASLELRPLPASLAGAA